MTRADPAPPDETAVVPPRVLVQGVSKRYASATGTIAALADVSLAIPAGAFFTLLGPSGCGKTTLLRVLAGFEHPDAGTIVLDGRHVAHDPPAARPVNTVFQSYALFPHMSVGENVAFALERQRLPRARIAARVAEMLALVRLEGYERRRPAQLSGGQQQRVALARAIAPQPKLLLLDEPLSALDRRLREDMQAELKRIQRESDLTFLLVTHDQGEALSMSDGIAVMNAGRVLQAGTPRTIYERPATRFVAEFLGANVLPGALFGLSAPFVAVRPEAIEAGPAAENGHAHDGHVLRKYVLDGRAESSTYLGARTSCVVTLPDRTALRIERGDLPPSVEPGAAVRLHVPRDAVVPLAD